LAFGNFAPPVNQAIDPQAFRCIHANRHAQLAQIAIGAGYFEDIGFHAPIESQLRA
jgi:hypothetical protein